MPGSKIEDRQYEIVFNMISVGSGKWEEILRLMNPVCIVTVPKDVPFSESSTM